MPHRRRPSSSPLSVSGTVAKKALRRTPVTWWISDSSSRTANSSFSGHTLPSRYLSHEHTPDLVHCIRAPHDKHLRPKPTLPPRYLGHEHTANVIPPSKAPQHTLNLHPHLAARVPGQATKNHPAWCLHPSTHYWVTTCKPQLGAYCQPRDKRVAGLGCTRSLLALPGMVVTVIANWHGSGLRKARACKGPRARGIHRPCGARKSGTSAPAQTPAGVCGVSALEH